MSGVFNCLDSYRVASLDPLQRQIVATDKKLFIGHLFDRLLIVLTYA